MDIELPTTDNELHTYDVEKLRALLPNLDASKEHNQLEVILQAIKYIQDLQKNLEVSKTGSMR